MSTESEQSAPGQSSSVVISILTASGIRFDPDGLPMIGANDRDALHTAIEALTQGISDGTISGEDEHFASACLELLETDLKFSSHDPSPSGTNPPVKGTTTEGETPMADQSEKPSVDTPAPAVVVAEAPTETTTPPGEAAPPPEVIAAAPVIVVDNGASEESEEEDSTDDEEETDENEDEDDGEKEFGSSERSNLRKSPHRSPFAAAPAASAPVVATPPASAAAPAASAPTSVVAPASAAPAATPPPAAAAPVVAPVVAAPAAPAPAPTPSVEPPRSEIIEDTASPPKETGPQTLLKVTIGRYFNAAPIGRTEVFLNKQLTIGSDPGCNFQVPETDPIIGSIQRNPMTPDKLWLKPEIEGIRLNGAVVSRNAAMNTPTVEQGTRMTIGKVLLVFEKIEPVTASSPASTPKSVRPTAFGDTAADPSIPPSVVVTTPPEGPPPAAPPVFAAPVIPPMKDEELRELALLLWWNHLIAYLFPPRKAAKKTGWTARNSVMGLLALAVPFVLLIAFAVYTFFIKSPDERRVTCDPVTTENLQQFVGQMDVHAFVDMGKAKPGQAYIDASQGEVKIVGKKLVYDVRGAQICQSDATCIPVTSDTLSASLGQKDPENFVDINSVRPGQPYIKSAAKLKPKGERLVYDLTVKPGVRVCHY